MEILTAGVVGAAVASSFLYAVWPLVRPPEETDGLLPGGNGHETRERELSRLLMERDQAYKGIVDLEFDRQMGKLSDEDFAQMMESARAHALEVLRKLEARGVEEGAVPVHLSEREVGQEAGRLAEAVPETEPEEDEDETEPTLDEQLEEEILAYRTVKPPEAAPAPKPAPKPKPAAPAAASPVAQAPGAVRFCPSCGTKVGEGHNFCASCGFKLR